MKINKKQLIWAIPILLLVVGASATLISYLSNTVSTDVALSAPIEFNLYGTDSNIIEATQTKHSGEILEFFKVAKNTANVGVDFAIVTVVKGTKDGVYVDSAGPIGDQVAKNTIGSAIEGGDGTVWNSVTDWYQIDGQAWYLHGAHNKFNDYKYLVGDVWTQGTNPENTKYNDAEGITIDGEDYYVIVFGGTIGDNSINVNTPIEETDTITNWGWGTPSSYTRRVVNTPLVMPSGAYDIGKVRVYFNQDLVPKTYTVKTAVVTPGYTISEIISDMFSTT